MSIHNSSTYCQEHKTRNTMYTVYWSLFMQKEWTPLMVASFNGHTDIVHALIMANADPSLKNEVMIATSKHQVCCICNGKLPCCNLTPSPTIFLSPPPPPPSPPLLFLLLLLPLLLHCLLHYHVHHLPTGRSESH